MKQLIEQPGIVVISVHVPSCGVGIRVSGVSCYVWKIDANAYVVIVVGIV